MDDIDARIECLKLATTLQAPDKNVEGVVIIATTLYSFVTKAENTPPADKPKLGRPPKKGGIYD
jgi:hypothetical protein